MRETMTGESRYMRVSENNSEICRYFRSILYIIIIVYNLYSVIICTLVMFYNIRIVTAV